MSAEADAKGRILRETLSRPASSCLRPGQAAYQFRTLRHKTEFPLLLAYAQCWHYAALALSEGPVRDHRMRLLESALASSSTLRKAVLQGVLPPPQQAAARHQRVPKEPAKRKREVSQEKKLQWEEAHRMQINDLEGEKSRWREKQRLEQEALETKHKEREVNMATRVKELKLLQMELGDCEWKLRACKRDLEAQKLSVR